VNIIFERERKEINGYQKRIAVLEELLTNRKVMEWLEGHIKMLQKKYPSWEGCKGSPHTKISINLSDYRGDSMSNSISVSG